MAPSSSLAVNPLFFIRNHLGLLVELNSSSLLSQSFFFWFVYYYSFCFFYSSSFSLRRCAYPIDSLVRFLHYRNTSPDFFSSLSLFWMLPFFPRALNYALLFCQVYPVPFLALCLCFPDIHPATFLWHLLLFFYSRRLDISNSSLSESLRPNA